MSFLLCGQTDSGKSTIAGSLLYKVGYFENLNDDDEKYYRKYLSDIEESKVKSKFSILLDLIDGEITTNKTKTQDFNIINFKYDNKNYTLIDTPGHKLYIRSLVEGLFKLHLDLVVIVLSNIDSEFTESFEKGTVKEDLLLCRSTNCKNLLVLWNKCDLASISNLNREIFVDYCTKLKFKNIEHLSVSGFTGDNLLRILTTVDKYRSVDETIITENIYYSHIIIDCFIFNDNVLITKGFACILHNQSGEFEITVDNIKDSRILKTNVLNKIKVSSSKALSIKTKIGDRVIFRSHSTTLGFGVVTNCIK